ncbi:PDxFFG protein [Mycoplasmopsis primatum]|uniref:PDxFFG protein n=1 Tax=Mycoplasmopsis primatum TaxID=55604 RepID=UPI00049733D1|nr:PDxFFG protein [Mycoplasmopsis primatum]
MGKINLKKQVWHKYVISAATLVGVTAITLGSMYGYSKTSNEKLGRKNPSSSADLKNIFIDRNAKPKTSFVEIHNNKLKVEYNPETELVTVDGKQINTIDYLDQYYAKNHALPYLNIQYGSFNFYNQYIEAVSPKEFYKFTQWFMSNVSWGPEIITLKSFSIVKGVEMNGNSITLGSHSNKNKEYTTIKFFPDAFFGTLPIYSSLSGKGNAQDSLTYKINKKVLTEPELRNFLANIAKYNALSNISEKTINKNFFRNITNVKYLKGQKVFAIRNNEWMKNMERMAFSSFEKNRLLNKSPYLLIIAAQNEEDARKKLSNKIDEYKAVDKFSIFSNIDPATIKLEEKIISSADINFNKYNDVNKIIDKELFITFNDGTSYTIHNSFNEILTSVTNAKGEKSFGLLNNFVQVDKAIEKIKNQIEDINSSYIESIRSKFQDNKFSNDLLEKSISQFNDYQLLIRKWLTLEQTISNMEKDVRGFSNVVQNISNLEKSLTEYNEQLQELKNQKQTIESQIGASTDPAEKRKLQNALAAVEKRIRDVEQHIAKAQSDVKAAKKIINPNTFINNKKEAIKERERFIESLEKNIATIEKAIDKAKNDKKLKYNLEKELVNLKFTIENVNQLNNDDKEVIEKVQNNKTSDGVLNAIIETLKKNKTRFTALWNVSNNTGKIAELKQELIQKFNIKPETFEVLSDIVTSYDSFINNVDIDKFLSKNFEKLISKKKEALIKKVHKTVFDYNKRVNKFLTGTEPKDEFIEQEYYFSDIAYLVNELASVETLAEADSKAQLNWRDFYNLKQFTDDRKNIIKNGETEFYVYSKQTKDLNDEFIKNNPHLGIDFNLNKIVQNQKETEKRIAEFNNKIQAHVLQVNNVFQILSPYFKESFELPNNFKLLGNNDLYKIFNDEQIFKEFWSSNPDSVITYLTNALNGISTSTNENKKLGLTGLLDKIKNNIPASNLDEFNKLISALQTSALLAEQAKDKNAALDIIVSYSNSLFAAKLLSDQWNAHKNESWFVSIAHLTALVNVINDVNKSISIANKLKNNYDELRHNLISKLKDEILLQRYAYQINFIKQLPTFSNQKLNDSYKKVLSLFDQKINEFNSLANENINLRFEFNQLLGAFISNNASSDLFSLVFAKKAFETAEKENNLKTTISDLNNSKAQNSAILTTKQNDLKTVGDALILALEATHENDVASNKNMKTMIVEMTKRVIDFVDEFNNGSPSVYQQLNNHYSRLANNFIGESNNLLNTVKSLKIQRDGTADLKEKEKLTTQINTLEDKIKKNSEVIEQIIYFLNQAEFFAKWYKEVVTEFNEIMTKVQADQIPALHFLILLNKLEGHVAEFINDKKLVIERNIRSDLNRLKAILGEIIQPMTLKYRLSTHLKSSEYFKIHQETINLSNSIKSIDIELKKLEDYSAKLTEFSTNADAKTAFDEYNNKLKAIADINEKIINSNNKISSILPKDGLTEIPTNPSGIEQALYNVYLESQNILAQDRIIKKANENLSQINEANYSLNKESEVIKAGEKNAGVTDDLKKYDEQINLFNNNVNEFIETFKIGLFIEQFKAANGDYDNHANRKYFINERIKEVHADNLINDEWKEFMTALFSNIDGLKPLSIATLKEFFLNIQPVIQILSNNLVKKSVALNDERKHFIQSISNEFNNKVISILQDIDEKDARSGLFIQKMNQLKDLIDNFKKQVIAENIADSEIKKLNDDFSKINSRIDTIISEASAYKTLLFGYIDHKAWYLNQHLRKEYLARMTLPFIQLAKRNDNKSYKELLAHINQKNKAGQISDAELSKWTNALAKIDKIYNEILPFNGKIETLPPYSGGLIDINEMFNKHVDRLFKSELKIDNQLKDLKTYLLGFKKLFDLQIASVTNHHKVYNLYKNNLRTATDVLIETRKFRIISDAKNHEANWQADQLTNADDLIVAKSKIELIDILTKKKILKPGASHEEIDRLIYKMDIADIQKDKTKLIFTLKNIDKENAYSNENNFGTKFVKFSVDANLDKNLTKTINDFFSTVGYRKIVAPTLIKEQNEIKNYETGKLEKTYDVFADAYENLTDELIKEVPYAGEWLEGLHISKKVNENGVMEYVLENGKYLGFTKDTRVGLWAILKMSDPNFKGISTDFLKFVGAHEYGHHITLNGAHDLSNKGSNPIFVSALTPNATPNINNYYSKDAVELYLKARTHVELSTKRLLDEFGAIKDYGEYGVFNFAKKDKKGNIVFTDNPGDVIKSMEKDSDIWGVDLESRDLWAALANKNRRFLQDFAGMLEAVKSRRVQNGLTAPGDEKWLSPFDMWIINAIDFYSGTLNPTVNSTLPNAAAVKYMVKDANTGEYVFMPASLSMLKGVIKDGKGNYVEFAEVERNGHIELVPKVVEGIQDAKGNYTLITKVLMFNKDGSPVINVPLNFDLSDKNNQNYDPYAVEFINKKIKSIENTIKSLIVDKFNINGWNTADTKLSVEPYIDVNYSTIKTLLGSSVPNTINKMFFNIYKNYVTNRDPQTGSYNFVGGKPLMIKYYNLDGSVNKTSGFPVSVPSSLIYGNPSLLTGGKLADVKFSHVLQTLFTAGNNLNNMMNAGAGQILYLDKDNMFMPNSKLDAAYTDLFFSQSIPKDYLQLFQIKKTMKWLSKYTPTFISSANNPNGIWNMMSNNNQIVTFASLKNADFNLVKKLRLNYSAGLRQLDNNVLNGLFGLFKNSTGATGINLEFNNYKEWLKFVTVDFKEAVYDANTKTVNWNIDYVKSKIDLDKFINDYKTNVLDKLDSMPELSDVEKTSFREFYKTAMDDSSNQIWANEVMRRFSSSLFAMFTSCYNIEQLKSNPNYMWIFDSKHGYGEFKKNEFKIADANSKKWEIDGKGLIKAYDKLAQSFGVSLSHLNLFDSLVFDGKIQAYTDQTFVNIALQKFGLLDIFTSLATASFWTSPSQDVIDYFATKNERKFNEMFSDYTYNFAEVINRDNLQITYSPANSEFGNMPAFLSGISEANTGLEYIVDGTATSKWLNKAIKLSDKKGRSGITNAIREYEELIDMEEKYKAQALGLKYRKSALSQDKNLDDSPNYTNSYFGEFQSINNGWFKDRWYRDFLGFKLYDDKGQEIVDDTIRIKDLEGNIVNTRARAYWQYYIQSQGVGRRNITSIWRDANKDAVAMFGYLSSDIADKANYLAFEDKETGEIKTLKITKNSTNNMFYYKTQHIENEKRFNEAKNDEERNKIRHTLAQEKYDYTDANGHHKGTGFVSWVSDYAIMSKYRNALLLPGHTYKIYFSSDAEGKKDILYADLGAWESLAENGKTFSQASIRIAKSEKPYKTDNYGNKYYEHTLYVYDQFNGVK